MHNMYPNYTETMKERGAAGLGHPDYPLEDYVPKEKNEVVTKPVVQSIAAERVLGYVSVNEMVGE